MSTITPVDRETASKINPLISGLWTEDTLDSLSSVIYELGYLAVADHNLETGHLFHVFGAIAAALEWEAENIHSVAAARKEEDHV